MDFQLASQLTQTLSLHPMTERDRYGAPLLGPAVSVAGLVFDSQARIFGAEGEQRKVIATASKQVILAPPEGLVPSLTMQVTLPGETAPRSILRLVEGRGENGTVSHYEVWL